jgi:hypothetical protein
MTKTNSDKTQIAVINTNIGFIQADISEIKDTLKGLGGVFASKVELVQIAKEAEMRLQVLEKANNYRKYIVPIFSSIISAFITFLVISYFEHLPI